MVDQDKFTRSAAPGWSRSARAVRDAAPVQCLGQQLEEDLYADLRTRGGLHNALLRHFEGQSHCADADPLVESLASSVWDRCLGPLIPLMVGPDGVFESVTAADAYCTRALHAARLEQLAARLRRRPDGGPGLRRPGRPQLSTSELLDEDAPVGAGW